MSFLATGANLFDAQVSTTTPGLSVTEFTVLSDSAVSFRLDAGETAPIGSGVVAFTTLIGSDTATITVAERVPIVSTDPNPIALRPDGAPIPVRLVFDEPFADPQTYEISVREPGIASVDVTTMDLPAGEIEATVAITGLALGSTVLDIAQPASFVALGIPVIVSEAELQPGVHAFHSPPVGVAAYVPPEAVVTGAFVSPPVGVGVYVEPSFNASGTFVAPVVGATRGTVLDSVSPASVSVGTSETLTIVGIELDAVTAVEFVPSTGITLSAPFTVNSGGTELTVPIDVAPGSPVAPRAIVLTTPAGASTFAAGVIEIAH